MLDKFRQNLRRWAVGLVLLFIVATFALWGINDYLVDSGNPVVASVNGTEITVQEFQSRLARDQAAYQNMLGAEYDRAMFEDPAIRRMFLQRLIDERLIVADALRQGFVVTDATVAQSIQENEVFRSNNQFDRERYLALVKQQGRTAPDFERQLRQSLLIDQVRGGVGQSALALKSDIERANQLHGQRRDLRYLLIQSSSLRDDSTPDGASIQNYYDRHPEEFLTTQMVSVDYVELRLDDFTSGVQVSEQALRDLYQERIDEFREPERRAASHILARLPENADAATVAQAKTRVEEIKKRLDAGESWSQLAEKLSDDEASAAKDGDLGLLEPGALDPEFEKAAFKLSQGIVSSPVRTPFGFHLIKVTKIEPASQQPFEHVRGQLETSQRRAAAEADFFSQVEILQTLSFEHPESLAVAAEAVNKPILHSEPFSRLGDSGIASRPEIIEQAFSTAVLEEGFNSDVVTSTDGTAVVLRLKDHIPATRRPLDQVREEIVATLKKQESIDKAQALGQEIADLLTRRDETTLAERLGTYRLEWQERRGVDRLTSDGVSAELRAAAFRAPLPDGDVPSYRVLATATGDYLVYTVTAVHPGQTQLPDAQSVEVITEIANLRAEALMAEYVNALRKEARIKIFDSAIQ